MKSTRWTAVAVLAAAFVASAGAPADASGTGHHRLVPASGRLAGFTGGQLLGQQFRQLLSLPVADNPLAGAGGSCFPGGDGKVLIVWTRPTAPTCTARPGTPIFLSTVFAECSKAEPPPYFGATEAAQRQCAVEQLQAFAASTFTAMLVSIDGGRPTDVYAHRYLAISPQKRVALPAPNILGVSARSTSFVAAAWVALIGPLSPGTHTINVQLPHLDGTADASQIKVDVSAAHR